MGVVCVWVRARLHSTLLWHNMHCRNQVGIFHIGHAMNVNVYVRVCVCVYVCVDCVDFYMRYETRLLFRFIRFTFGF